MGDKDETLDSLMRLAEDQLRTTNDRKVYASHSEMAVLKEAGAVIEEKESLSPLHFEAVFERTRFIHVCSEQNPECVEGVLLTGGSS